MFYFVLSSNFVGLRFGGLDFQAACFLLQLTVFDNILLSGLGALSIPVIFCFVFLLALHQLSLVWYEVWRYHFRSRLPDARARQYHTTSIPPIASLGPNPRVVKSESSTSLGLGTRKGGKRTKVQFPM